MTGENSQHCAPSAWGRKFHFWCAFVIETFAGCRLSPLVKARLGRARPDRPVGLEKVPTRGNFVLAVNHYTSGAALDVVAAAMSAITLARPDLADHYLIIVGRRQRSQLTPAPLPARLVRRVVNSVYRRWQDNAMRIALGNETISIRALREWRSRVRCQPVLVFPEGKSQLQFGAIRPGAGRWLAMLGVPVVPVGVWWQGKQWQVRIGAPLKWSHRPELHDAQLGLAIAHLLPSCLAAHWQQPLEQWRAAHLPLTVNPVADLPASQTP